MYGKGGHRTQSTRAEAASFKRIIHMAGATVLLLGGLLFFLTSCTTQSGVDAASLRGGETRETLPAYYFSGVVAEAYRIAAEIPEVIDSLYCYCHCKENFGHKSLLTCYVDDHAARCGVCIDEAVAASRMHAEGRSIPEIRKAVDRTFSRSH